MRYITASLAASCGRFGLRGGLHVRFGLCSCRVSSFKVPSTSYLGILCAEIVQDKKYYFLALATLRGTILSADIELTMLSMSTFAGITGAPYGILRVDPDLFLPFQGGLDGVS